MPTTVQNLFSEFGISTFIPIPWARRFEDKEQGVYIVSTSNNENSHFGVSPVPTFNEGKFKDWIDGHPDLRIDNNLPTVQTLKGRLAEFWLPDESILYIGKAEKRKNGDGLSCRVGEFYCEAMGNSAHSGGHWIKSLSNLSKTTIYYCHHNEPKKLEEKMLQFFMKNVSSSTLSRLRDKRLPLPFANLQLRPKVVKSHGLLNQT